MPRLDHVDLVVAALEDSLPFYRDLLKPLGWRDERQVKGERGETIHYLWGPGGGGSIGLRERQSSEGLGGYDRYSVGLHHIAFSARSRRRVDERAQWIRDAGAGIESGPAEYDYTPGYYAVFFNDPDGMKLEIVHRPLLRTALWALNPRTS
jgi:glyoxylase I family protein